MRRWAIRLASRLSPRVNYVSEGALVFQRKEQAIGLREIMARWPAIEILKDFTALGDSMRIIMSVTWCGVSAVPHRQLEGAVGRYISDEDVFGQGGRRGLRLVVLCCALLCSPAVSRAHRLQTGWDGWRRNEATGSSDAIW